MSSGREKSGDKMQQDAARLDEMQLPDRKRHFLANLFDFEIAMDKFNIIFLYISKQIFFPSCIKYNTRILIFHFMFLSILGKDKTITG